MVQITTIDITIFLVGFALGMIFTGITIGLMIPSMVKKAFIKIKK